MNSANSRSRRGSSSTSFACCTGVSTLRSSFKRSSLHRVPLGAVGEHAVDRSGRARRRRAAVLRAASWSSRAMSRRSRRQRHLLIVVAGKDREQPRRRVLVELELLDDLPGPQRAHPIEHLLAQLVRRSPVARGRRARARPAAAAAGRTRDQEPTPRPTPPATRLAENLRRLTATPRRANVRPCSNAAPSSSASTSFTSSSNTASAAS